MGNDKLNSMECEMTRGILKDHVVRVIQGYIDQTGVKLNPKAINMAREYMEEVIDRCVEHKDFILSMCTYATISTLDNSCKMVHDKWLPEMERVGDE